MHMPWQWCVRLVLQDPFDVAASRSQHQLFTRTLVCSAVAATSGGTTTTSATTVAAINATATATTRWYRFVLVCYLSALCLCFVFCFVCF